MKKVLDAVDYPALRALRRRIYEMPGVAATFDVEYTKQHYFGSHRNINPTGIVPVGPDLSGWLTPHGREQQHQRREPEDLIGRSSSELAPNDEMRQTVAREDAEGVVPSCELVLPLDGALVEDTVVVERRPYRQGEVAGHRLAAIL